jgi:tetratricopeptide (TPR) repeat protein/predicted Ser/Thr protein kinase
MAENRICGQCAAEIPLDAPQGLCLQCLAKVALSFAKPASETARTLESDLEKIRYFGDYELLEEIARGGMGVVYRARQVSLNRIVAVKMLLFGKFSSDEFLKRFQTEARAAASLQHPNIVAIHEIGEHEGQQYFSMDYVPGKSLGELVREGPLPPKRAATYLKTIAEAIRYAHQHGILHRDLKPSNVLIDEFDQPRITDFGLAKQLQNDSELTKPGHIMGSPSYMPPEQVSSHRRATGTYTDVYSLGAVLYHLLTGRPPFAADTLERTLFQLLNKEPVAPRLLVPGLPPDLETICLKCLRKEPQRRYQSAQELAEDLGRFLAGKPVLARPVSHIERFCRWAKREPTIAGLSVAVLAILLAGTVVSTWQAVRAERGLGLAQAESEGNDQVVEFLREMLKAINQAVAEGRDTAMIQELVDKAAARMDQKVLRHHRAEANLHDIIGQIYLDLHVYDRAESMFTNALAAERQMHGDMHPHLARYLNALGQVLIEQGRLDQAEVMLSEALRINQTAKAPNYDDLDKTRCLSVDLFVRKGRLSEAETCALQVLESRRRQSGSADFGVLQAQSNLGVVFLCQGRLQEAEQILQKIVSVARTLPEIDKQSLTMWLRNLAAVLSSQGQYAASANLADEALTICKESLGPEHPMTIESMIRLGLSLSNLGDYPAAETNFTKVLAMLDKLKLNEDPLMGDALDGLSMALYHQDKLTNAEPAAVKALALRERHFGPQNLAVARSLEGLAKIYKKQGKLSNAEGLASRSLAIHTTLLGPENLLTADSTCTLAIIFRDQGRFSEADAKFRDALMVRRKFLAAEHPDIAITLYEFAHSLLRQHNLPEAEPLAIESLKICTKVFPSEAQATINALDVVARVLFDSKRFDLAEVRLRKLVRVRQKVFAPDDPRTGEALDLLTGALWEQDKHQEAESTFQQALPIYLKLLRGGDTNAIRVLNRFAWAVLAENGKTQQAEDLLNEILSTEKQLHGYEHPIVAERLNNFGTWQFQTRKQFDDAEEKFNEALTLRRKLSDNQSGAVADSLKGLGQLYGELGRWHKAEEKFREAVELETKRLGKQHLEVINMTFDLVRVLEKQDKHKEAAPILLDLHDSLQQSPEAGPQEKRDSFERLRRFYISWALAAPNTGKMEKAMEWTRKLTEFDETSRDTGPKLR